MDSHRSSNTSRSQSHGKTIPRRTRGDAIVGRANSPAANGSRCSLLLSSAPDVGVGNVFSVCSASYPSGFYTLLFVTPVSTGNLLPRDVRAVRNIIIDAMCIICTRASRYLRLRISERALLLVARTGCENSRRNQASNRSQRPISRRIMAR